MNRKFSLKTIGFIFTDIGFFQKTDSKAALLEIHKFFEKYPELSLMAHLQPFFVGQQDSQIDFWKTLARHVADHYQEVDSFVVVADPGSILYPAVAMSFILEGLDKPVVFTGLPFAREKLDWYQSVEKLIVDRSGLGVEASLISALQLAVVGRKEVMVAYGPQAVRAVRAQQVRGISLEYFDSIDDKGISRIGLDLELASDFAVSPDQSALRLRDHFESRLELFSLAPDEAPETTGRRINRAMRAVVLDTTRVGYFSPKWVSVIDAHRDTLFLLYPSPGNIQPFARLPNVLLAPNVSLETAFVKFSWLLSGTSDKTVLARELQRDQRGELSGP